METPGSLGGVMVSTLAWNAGNVGSIPAIFPIFITLHDTGCHDHDPVQALHCVVVDRTLCIYVCMVTACMSLFESIKRLTIPGGTSAVVVCTDLEAS